MSQKSRYQKQRERCAKMAHVGKPVADSAKIAKNTLVLFLRMLAVMVVGLFTSRVQIDALGVTDYGLYQVAVATVSILCFLNGPMSMASSRFLTVEMGKGTVGSLKRMFSTILIVHFALAIALVVVLETVGIYLLGTRLNIDPSRLTAVRWAFHCAVFTTFLGVTQVPYSAMIIAHERMSAFAYMSFYDVGSKLIIAYSIYISPVDKLMTYATLLAMSSLTTVMIYRVYCVRNFAEARFRKVFDFSLIKPVFSFTGWQVISQIVVSLITQGLVMVNQRYFGPVLVAAVSVATTVRVHSESIMNSFKAAANPQITKLYAAGAKEGAQKLLKETVLFSVILFASVAIPVWFYAPELLRMWLGHNVPQLAPTILRIVLIGAFGTLFDWSFFVIISADGRIGPNTWFDALFYGLGFVVAVFLVVVYHNPLASSLAMASVCLIQGFVEKPILLKVQMGYKLSYFIGIFASAILAVGICALIAYPVAMFMPDGAAWSLCSCAIIAFESAFVLASVLSTREMCSKIPVFLGRFGKAGVVVAPFANKYFTLLYVVKGAIAKTIKYAK